MEAAAGQQSTLCFVSYSSSNEETVAHLQTLLSPCGVTCWTDLEQREPGAAPVATAPILQPIPAGLSPPGQSARPPAPRIPRDTAHPGAEPQRVGAPLAGRMATYRAVYRRCAGLVRHRHPQDPIDYVDCWDAYAYCNWRGLRLPTRVELEIAYSGGTNSTHPWGNTCERLRLLEYGSPYGVEGLVARFTEWTGDYRRNLLAQGDKPRIIRGGILDSEAEQKLFSMSAFMGCADAGDASSAFRCARNKRTPIIEQLVAKVRSLRFRDPAPWGDDSRHNWDARERCATRPGSR